MKRDLLFIVSLFALAILAGCASIGNPSGGPRDEEPPRFVRANPAPGSANVSNHIRRVKIDFDELVNVKDAFQKVVVSPPSAQIPRVASQGHSVMVEFRDTLEPNTTYTIDFGNAIEDNNESNPLENFSYTFSTGPTIDTLRIAGMALNALSLEPMQQKLIGVYKLDDEKPVLADSMFTTTRFTRVAKTDERGRFSVEGLAAGVYRIFALDDTDNNFIYSSPDEEMGYSTQIIRPYAEQDVTIDSIFDLKKGRLDTVVNRSRTVYYPNNILLRTFLTSRRRNFISKYERNDSSRLDIMFGAQAKMKPKFTVVGAPDLKDWYVEERSQHNDTISLWLKQKSLMMVDTLRVKVEFEALDSLNRYTTQTDTLRFVTDRAALRKAREAEEKRKKKEAEKNKKKGEEGADSVAPEPVPMIAVTYPAPGSHDIYAPMLFDVDVPLARLDTTMLYLEMKIDTIWKPVEFTLQTDSLNPRRRSVTHKWDYGKQYRFTTDSLAMLGINGLYSAKTQNEFKIREEKEYCSLTLKLSDWPRELPAVVELLGSNDTPIRREPLKHGSVTFKYLQPAKYYVRVVNDLNGNGEWDTGDYVEHRQVEEAYYYPKQISIKQNWNKEETWEVFATPVDEMKPEAIRKNKPAKRGNRPDNKKTTETEDEEDE